MAREGRPLFNGLNRLTLPPRHFALPVVQNHRLDGLRCRPVDDEGAIQFGQCGILFP